MFESELDALTLTGAAALIRSGGLSPVELTRTTLARIERLNPEMRMYITVMSETAMADARKAESALASGKPVGALCGVPISVKDLFDIRGVPTTAGSRVFKDRIPPSDSTVVRRLRRAGAVIVGKTNLHEFAFGVTSTNPHYGAVRNPHDHSRIAGGSSGGSASSVALSAGLGAIGTDTGGSIRIPAALCGTVGLKPTYGAIDMTGVIPLAPSLDHAGPIAKTVDDCRLLFDVLRRRKGPRIPDRKLRMGVPKSFFFDALDPAVASAVGRALSRLETHLDVVPVDIPSASEQQWVFAQLATPEALLYHQPLLDKHAALYGEDVRSRLETARTMLATDYLRAQEGQRKMIRECREIFESVDMLVTPTLPILAPKIGVPDVAPQLTRFTRIFNLTGLPAVSVPCGPSVGLQIAGPALHEDLILHAAGMLSEAQK